MKIFDFFLRCVTFGPLCIAKTLRSSIFTPGVIKTTAIKTIMKNKIRILFSKTSFELKIGRPIFTRFLRSTPEWPVRETEKGLFWTPDFEVSTQVHEAHEIEHAVVVTLFAVGDGGIPKRVYQGLRGLARSGGKAAHCGCGQHTRGVALGKGLAVEGVAIHELVDSLAF